jgi:cysteinyl-tRNA synthetase
MLQIYNTLTREIEPFRPLRQEIVKVYSCGPTPYNFAHIGNLRTYLFEDFVIRTLRFFGYKASTVMNITDIDDKTIRDSMKTGIPLGELTEKYTALFLEDLAKLRILPADTVVPISTLIDEMVSMIQTLLDRGYAYVSEDGSVYYSISKFKKYGQLAHLDMAGMKSSVRINNDEYEKDSVADFALWKSYEAEKDGPNKWEATFRVDGKEITLPGRPGWHIECSACNFRFHGKQIDLHMGGADNLFPHHQNELAQTEACTGKPFSQYWMHGGHLLVDNKKMAKSAGNFHTLRDVIEKMAPIAKESDVCRAFRLMALQTQYRESFNFTFDRLESAIRTVAGFDETLRRLARYRTGEGKVRRDFRERVQATVQAYSAALENDISTAEALAVVFDFQTFVNSEIDA